MNKELWQSFDKLRNFPARGYEGLAELFHAEGIRFATRDLATWVQFFSARVGRASGTVHAPEWLAGVFCELAKEVSPRAICDPWAGVGFLIEMLRDACQPERALAFTQSRVEFELGTVLVPEVGWQLGESLSLLESTTQSFDVVASILPMGSRARHPLNQPVPSGAVVELTDDLGNLVLVAASMRLRSSGIGLFVVTPSFFTSLRSVFGRFGELGLGIEAALALPSGTFAPYTNIPAYLVVVRRRPIALMFVAQVSADTNTNLQVIKNFREEREGGSLELGRFVAPQGFRGIERLRATEALALAEKRFGVQAMNLAELKEVKFGIKLGRPGDEFTFQALENAIYIPLVGIGDVVEAPDALKMKPQNYAQIIIDPTRSYAGFVARFLNSDFGRQLREQGKTGTAIRRLNTEALRELRVFVPDMATQRRLLAVEAKLTVEQTTVMALQNELTELRRELWASSDAVSEVEQSLAGLSNRLSGGIKQHASETLDQWFETLPFPLSSILRAWQATPTRDFKTRYEHLLHFFEGTAEFVSVVLLSAFSSNEVAFASHRRNLAVAMQKKNLGFARATFGTWKLVVEFLGKQTRDLLAGQTDDATDDRSLCANMFADPSLSLPYALSRKELAAILTTTNKMRNDWGGHSGVVGPEEAEVRNQQLLLEVEKLREAIADIWTRTQLIHALTCRPRRGQFENEVAILMGSHNEFLKETRSMATWLDVEHLYLVAKDSGRALKLLPLVRIGSSPSSAQNACYFFNRLERDGARFVSYHFTDKPELTGQFVDATEAIRLLSEDKPG